ncbi:MAG: phosphoethanolamine transferase [Kiritimatiellae bacterium]|nr:phosphoethanolamine transferase [Kiritimatiellia bacterium]
MRRNLSFFFVLALFGSMHAYWAISKFGFQAVDLPPVQFFLFSLWSCVRDITTYTLLLSATVFLFGRFARWVVTAIWAYIVIVVCSCVYVKHVFHAELSSIWIELLMNTSIDEVIQFIKMSFGCWQVAGLILVCAVIALPCVVLQRLPPQSFSRRSVLIGLGLTMPFLIINVITMNWHWGVAQMPYTNFLVSSAMSYERDRGFRRACENKGLPSVVSTNVSTNDLPNIVIVLGESATRNNWHLYGYERHTTPRMDEICASGEGVALKDVVGIVPATVRALSFLLTDVTLETLTEGHWTIAEVMRRAGYSTVAISNQQVWNGMTSLLGTIFNGCEKRISMFVEKKGLPHYDESMVPYLRSELSKPGPQAVFIHLAGMHYPVRDACPKKERHFDDNVEGEALEGLSAFNRDRRNRYDDGILYEDKVLGMIVDVMKEEERPSIMFFISDHGESPRSDGWRVYTDMDVYELPCVFWMSPKYQIRFPKIVSSLRETINKPLQPDMLTGGLLEMAQIELSHLNTTSFLLPDFKCRIPRKIDSRRLNYETLKKGVR